MVTGYLGSAAAPSWLSHELDLWFLADIARGMERDARFDESFEAADNVRTLHQQIAAGTADALLWVLGPVLVSPATGRRKVDRSRAGLVAELEAAVMRRAMATSDSPDWCYLGGVADALELLSG